MKKSRRFVFFTLILSFILIIPPMNTILSQEKKLPEEKRDVKESEVEPKDKKPTSEIKKESEIKEKKPLTTEEKILEAERKGFEKLLEEGIRLTPELESKIQEVTKKRFQRLLEETIGVSPIEENFNQRVPSLKNKLEQEIKEKILTDRSLSPEETKTLRENLGKSLLKEFDRKMEKDFEKDLMQFGYNTFQQPASPFAPIESAPVGPDYVLGPEDTLIIQMWGMTNEVFKLTLSRDGNINLPKVGALYLWGTNFNDAEKKIKEGFLRFYKDIQIDVSLGSLRNIKVFVLGEVKKSGGYTISSLSTLLHGLYYAGGPTKLGSLRNIKLIRKGDQDKVFDLYPLLLQGERKGDLRLLNDDIIFVPHIEAVVGISGNVKNPAIYEMMGPTKLMDVVKMSGGFTPSAYLQKIQVNRIVANKQVTTVELEISNLDDLEKSPQNIEMKDKDLILISSIDKRKRDYVSIKGNVHRPGDYKMSPEMKVSDLINKAGGLLPETYMERTEILRFKSEYTREILSLEVSQALKKDPTHDLLLKEWDIIEIKSIFDIFPKPIVYISGEVNKQISGEVNKQISGEVNKQISGEVQKPFAFRFVPGMRISDLIYQAQGLKDTAFLEKAELYRKNYGRDKPQEIIMVNLRAVLQRDKEADLLLEKEDHLFIRPNLELTEKWTVTINGQVRFPGAYVIKKGDKLGSVIERVGGFSPHAFLTGAVFTRKTLAGIRQPIIDDFIKAQKRILLEREAEIAESNYSLEGKEARRIALTKKRDALNLIGAKTFLGRIIINLNHPETKNFLLEDGDALTIPVEPQWVLIVGEVLNAESIAYVPGKAIEFYLNKVGGITEKADRNGIHVIKPDGQVESKATGFSEITKGDIIVVPSKFE